MCVQRFRDGQCVGLVNAHAREQRAHAAEREEAVERCTGEPEAIRPPCEQFDMSRVTRDNRAAHDVTVAVEVLRGGVHDEIGAEREGALQRGGEESVVGDHECTCLVTRGAHGSQVRDAQQRIARRLDPQQVRREARNRLRGVGRREVRKLQLDLVACRECAQQPIRSAITVVCGEHLSAGRRELERKAHCRHARTGDDGSRALLEAGERIGQLVARWIPRPRVVIAALLVEPGKGKVRGQVQRRNHRAMMLVAANARANAARDGGPWGLGRMRHQSESEAVRMAPRRSCSVRNAS